jgi:hypothetical protein
MAVAVTFNMMSLLSSIFGSSTVSQVTFLGPCILAAFILLTLNDYDVPVVRGQFY